jgi:hypothetical protein
MAPARVLISMMALVLLGEGSAVGQDDDDVPLRPSAGLYRGTVVDDSTGRPLPGVVVVILWQRLDDEIKGLRRLSGAREAFTDEHGEFVHDVGRVEARLRPGTFAPRIVMFRPGYAPLPSQVRRSPPGVAAEPFTQPGAVVRLTPVGDYEDRVEAFNTFIAMLNTAHLFPATELPRTEELIRSELETFGVRPMAPASPKKP